MSYSIAHEISAKGDDNIKTWQIFLLILLANLLLAWFHNNIILTREVYHNILSEQLDANRIDEYFDFTRKLSVWGYIVQPMLFWLQIMFFALLIHMPLVIMFIDIPFIQVFRIVTVASISPTILSFVQLLRLSFYHENEITRTALETIPFSLTNLLDPIEYSKSAYFVLGKFNLFEILWCIILYRGLVATAQIKRDTAMILVSLFWIVLLLFQWGIFAYFEGVN